jgi:uncharacterized protein YdhG (YjbR/CyaY superfamily)
MNKSASKYKTVDEYIELQPEELREVLQELRKVIKEEAPDTVESISYQMPTFKLNGKPLIYFAGWKDHIALYPTASNLESAIPEAADYRTGKGTLKFPLAKPIPFTLIRRIVKFRIKEIESISNKGSSYE